MSSVTSNVSIRALGKRFGDTRAVSDASIEIENGEFLVLVGPSGSGKSTVLRMIAGLEDPSEGSIAIGENDVTHLAPKDRDIAMVFQDYALYPHMTVYDNMAFALQSRRAPRRQIEERVQDAARILNIEDLLARYPAQLSGGQRQRVAMGRAIVRQPKVFLFDEPLSNLDAKLRVQMRTEIKRLHQRLGTTIVYVTHDQVEAMTLASRIVIMRNGLIEQIGTPEEVYHRPVNRFVAGFVGSPSMNFIPCELGHDGAMLAVKGGGRLSLESDSWREIARLHGTRLLFGIRPENLLPSTSGAENSLAMTVEVVEPLGSDTLVIGRIGDTETIARFPQGSTVRAADRLWVAPDMTRAHLFDADQGERLEGHR